MDPLGFLECEHIPFGLTNAPATFQKLMESCLGKLHLNWCIIYLDDISVFSQTPDGHLYRLQAVFNKLRAAGLKLKPSNCDLFKQQINYLGHVVSNEEVSTDPEKIKSVTEWLQPTTVTEVRSFLGFVSYYRRFIPNFSKVSKPPISCHKTWRGHPVKRKNSRFIGGLSNRRPLQLCKGSVLSPQYLHMQTVRLLSSSTLMLVGMDWVQCCIKSRRGISHGIYLSESD